MPTPPLLVLDLDGTLVDTADDLLATLNTVLADEGLPPVTRAQAGHLLGAGARAMIQRGFALADRPLDEATLDRLFDVYIPLYAANIAVHSRPYPGAIAALDRFAAEGWRLAVCTNKPETLSRRLLGELDLVDRFAAICGGDTFPVRKPDATHLFGTIARAGGEAATTVMVGDSHTDIATARNAGVPVVAVDFGYSDRPIAEYAPDRVIGHFEALAAAVADLRRTIG